MRVKKPKGFTILEITIVVIIVGVIITIIPLRMQTMRAHTDLSLVMQQREDLWQRTITSMRQGRRYDNASIQITTGAVNVVYSGGTNTGTIEILRLPEGTSIQGAITVTWDIQAYSVSCVGYASGFAISVGNLQSCYHVDLNSCSLIRNICNK